MGRNRRGSGRSQDKVMDAKCKICGNEMVVKSKSRLLLVGLLMIASVALTRVIPYLWPFAIILFLTGLYLIIWATLGRARWCRSCKQFGVF
jgi:hypothetical protein